MQSSIVSCSCDGKGGGFTTSGGSTNLLAVDSVRVPPLECGSSPEGPCHAPTQRPSPVTTSHPGTQTFEDCTAKIGGGGVNQASMELVDCRILRCHATSTGGGLNMWPDRSNMTGGTISGCSARSGGGVHMDRAPTYRDTFFVNVLVTNCRATGDKEDDGGGGILVSGGAFLKMSGGSIHNCAARSYGGGLRVMDSTSQVQLSGMSLQGCTASNKGGCVRIDDGDVLLVDVSLEECGLEAMCSGAYALHQKTGTLGAERVRVGHSTSRSPSGCLTYAALLQGHSEWSDSTFSDCDGTCFESQGGRHAVVRASIVRAAGVAANADPPSILTMTDSYIADCENGCVRELGGTLVLRNMTLKNCTARPHHDGTPYIRLLTVETATNFQAELLTLELSCEEDLSTALIKIWENSAFAAPLSVRGLRVVAPAACSSTNFSVFSDNVRPVNCSEYNYAPCDATATCTEVPPLPAVPTLKTVDCSCEGGAAKAATSRALAPYGFNPSSIGLPDKPVDYCVRPSTVTPQTTTKAAQVRGSHAPPPPAAAHRSRHVRRLPLTSVASVWRR